MIPGEFLRRLQKLNSKLRVCCKDGPYAAGLYIIESGEYVDICGIDKNWVPEHTAYDKHTGQRTRSGWRRVLRILIQKSLVDRKAAERLFQTQLHYDTMTRIQLEADPVVRALADARERGRRESIKKTGQPVEDYYKWQDLVEIHRMRKKTQGGVK